MDAKTIVDRVFVFLSEFLSTIIFTTVVCFSCASKMWMSFQFILLHLALGHGFALLMGVQFGSHISGGHVNPIVTLAACILGKKALIDLPLYIAAQISGALVGYLFVWVGTAKFYRKEGDVGICSSFIHPELSPAANGILVEFFASFILILAYCGMWDSRNRIHLDAIAVKLAFIVSGEVLAFGHITGCHMNPARSFAPALFSIDFRYVWYLITGQVFGGICAAAIYRSVFALPYVEEMEPWVQ